MSDENDDDFETDDLFNKKNEKKKVDGKKKGNRVELAICKLFKKTWVDELFSRSVGSGNRWSQTDLTTTAKKVFSSDLVCPDNFKFSIEVKGGYSSVNITNALTKGNKTLDGFLHQASTDADRTNLQPMLCWKQDHKPWLCFIRNEACGDWCVEKIFYRENWTCMKLMDVLKLPKTFFFS